MVTKAFKKIKICLILSVPTVLMVLEQPSPVNKSFFSTHQFQTFPFRHSFIHSSFSLRSHVLMRKKVLALKSPTKQIAPLLTYQFAPLHSSTAQNGVNLPDSKFHSK